MNSKDKLMEATIRAISGKLLKEGINPWDDVPRLLDINSKNPKWKEYVEYIDPEDRDVGKDFYIPSDKAIKELADYYGKYFREDAEMEEPYDIYETYWSDVAEIFMSELNINYSGEYDKEVDMYVECACEMLDLMFDGTKYVK